MVSPDPAETLTQLLASKNRLSQVKLKLFVTTRTGTPVMIKMFVTKTKLRLLYRNVFNSINVSRKTTH